MTVRFRLRYPQTTARWRLTLFYGGMFLACGALLLALTYVLVAHASVTASRPPGSADMRAVFSPRPLGGRNVLKAALGKQRVADLHLLIIESAVALATMAIVSGFLGWVVAGRVLRPLRTITAVTQEISQTNLHERLAMTGPRDELTLLADTIDGLLARLEAAFAAQQQFVANASHELRTPLTMMRASLDVAVAKPGGVPSQVKALDVSLRQDLDRADRLLESFLTLARAEHGQLGGAGPMSLAQIVSEALSVYGDEIAEKQIVLHASVAPINLTGSETLLRRMVDNVIENATCYNQPHGFLGVALGLEHGQAQLVVDSDGQLLNPVAVAQLAQPFRRLGADRTDSHKGQGLGLSIVAAIAAAHGGTLQLEARSTGGLRVRIMLPGATTVTRAANLLV